MLLLGRLRRRVLEALRQQRFIVCIAGWKRNSPIFHTNPQSIHIFDSKE